MREALETRSRVIPHALIGARISRAVTRQTTEFGSIIAYNPPLLLARFPSGDTDIIADHIHSALIDPNTPPMHDTVVIYKSQSSGARYRHLNT